MRNLYFSAGARSEQNLYEDLIIESIKIYGQDLYYLPRDLVNVDDVFREDPESRFNSNYLLEMYVDNADGFDGEGDLFTKFGVEIRDNATFVVARSRWSASVKKYDNENWLSAMTVKMENTTMSEFFDADEDSQLKSFYDGEISKITDKFSLEAIEELKAESKRDLIPVSDLLKSEPAIQKLINSDINIFTDDKTTPNINEGETIIEDIMDNLGITNIDYTDDLNEVRDSIVNFDGNIVLPELEEGMFDFFTDKDEKSEEAQGQAFVEGLSKILKRPVTKTFYNANMTESDKESISKIFNINSNQLDELVAKYLQ